jgi:hypothetical protein
MSCLCKAQNVALRCTPTLYFTLPLLSGNIRMIIALLLLLLMQAEEARFRAQLKKLEQQQCIAMFEVFTVKH